MDTRRGRWVTGTGTALVVFFIGAALGPGDTLWIVGLVVASALLLVGIGARV